MSEGKEVTLNTSPSVEAPETSAFATSSASAFASSTSNNEKFGPTQTPPESSSSTEDDEFIAPPIFSCMTGIKDDLKARAPLYFDDWKKPESLSTVINATVYAFMVQLIPALIFAELLDRQTEGKLAVAETLMSSGIIGIIYAVFAGQPLVIMGVTGPVAILLGTSYQLAEVFDADYFSFFWWTCIWAGLLHMISAMIGVVNFVWQITPFTLQIFELFIASAFIYSGVRDLVTPIGFVHETLSDASPNERSGAYASLIIGLCTCGVCWTLHFADTWTYWTRELRTFLAAYNMVVALVMMTALSYLPGIDQGGAVDRVNIRVTPWDWQPTDPNRSWWVSPTENIDTSAIFGALFPGLMFYLLFFIDHNVSSILSQLPKYNLKKPPAYHWDFFVLGVTFLPCGMMGLPPGNGLIPQAPLHTRSLCTKEFKEIDGVTREVYTKCEEQRWSAFFQAALMFVALSAMTVISWIPVGSLFGVLLYLGMVALHGNAVWERVRFNAMMPKKRPPVPVVVQIKNWRTVQLFTAVQVGCTAIIFGVAQFASIGYIFPALIASLVPFRTYVVSRLFSEADLKYLDPLDEAFAPPGGASGYDDDANDKNDMPKDKDRPKDQESLAIGVQDVQKTN